MGGGVTWMVLTRSTGAEGDASCDSERTASIRCTTGRMRRISSTAARRAGSTTRRRAMTVWKGEGGDLR